MNGFAFPIGTLVRIDGLGLSGVSLRTLAMFVHPSGQPFYRLAFAHNGNAVPGLYDQRLMSRLEK